MIARAIDIDVDADAAAIAAEGAEAEALAKAIDVCIDAGDRMGACLDALTECADGIPVLTDDPLRACMTDAGFPRQ